MKEVYCIVHWRVQIVLYRDFAVRHARRLGLAGYVKNLPDGSVEIVAQGQQEKLEKFIEQLRKGSFLSRVDGIEVQWHEKTRAYGDFLIVW